MLHIARLLKKSGKGFTIVELLIVMVLSMIMLGGMVGLLTMGFTSFSTSKKTQSLADAARRALPAMDRQMKCLLHINDDECVANYKVTPPPAGVWNGTSFYADIDNDNTADVETYTNAEKVEFYLSGGKLMQRTTEPGGGGVTTTSLCSYVESVRFYYFAAGVAPANGALPANRYTGDSLNDTAGSIKVVLVLRNGDVTKTFEQNTFLRVLVRTSTGT